MEYDPDLRSKKHDDDKGAQESFASAKNFSPLYFMWSRPTNKLKIEMSFNFK